MFKAKRFDNGEWVTGHVIVIGRFAWIKTKDDQTYRVELDSIVEA